MPEQFAMWLKSDSIAAATVALRRQQPVASHAVNSMLLSLIGGCIPSMRPGYF
jgi:hypothetical protein